MAGTGFLKVATGVLMTLLVQDVCQAASNTRMYGCANGVTFFLQLNEQENGAPGRTASFAFPGAPGNILMLDPTQDGLVYESTDYRISVFKHGAVQFGEMSRGKPISTYACSLL